MVPKIIIEKAPNPHFRSYHVNTEISQKPRSEFLRPLRDSSKKYLKQMGKVGSSLIKSLFVIPGVNRILITPYKLSVIKGAAFDWKEIEPSVLEALKQAFGELEQEVMVTREVHFESPPAPREKA